MPTVTSFWMVYGEKGGAPTFKHKSETSAEVEAARLARLTPGVKFWVLEAKAAAEIEASPVKWTHVEPF